MIMIFTKSILFFNNGLKINPISIGCGNFFCKWGKILHGYYEV